MGKFSSYQRSVIDFIGAVILFIALVTADIYLYSITLVKLWIPLTISIGGSILLWFIMRYVWELLLPKTPAAVRFLVNTIFFTAVVGCILLLLNWAGAEGMMTSGQRTVQGLFDWPVLVHQS